MNARAIRSITVVVTLLLTFKGVADAASATFTLDPRASYLRANGETPPNALAIDLSLLSATPGSTLLLEIVGDYIQAPGAAPVADTIGVFSSSTTLLAAFSTAPTHNRVVGALDAGVDFPTGPTFFPRPNGQATDIPQDFLIGTSLSRSLQ